MDDISLKRNFSYAFAAQGVALAVGCITNLILPRVLGAEDFSWWQLFTFYATYIPCLALGINDGVYLRYGGKDKSQLDPAALRSQFWVGAAFQLVLAAALGALLGLAVTDPQRRAVLLGALAVALMVLMQAVPVFAGISEGFRVIIATILAAGAAAFLFPVREEAANEAGGEAAE